MIINFSLINNLYFCIKYKSLQIILVGGKNVKENAEIFNNIIDNREKGAKLDIILLNTGALLYISGIAKDIEGGIKLAKEAIESGKARETLNNVIKVYGE